MMLKKQIQKTLQKIKALLIKHKIIIPTQDTTHIPYIRQNNNTYTIQKNINGKTHYYGTYKTLGEAVEKRDQLKQNNWKQTNKPTPTEMKYISKHPQGGYIIQKSINGQIKYYGKYKTLEEAQKQIQYHIKTGWTQKPQKKQDPDRYITKTGKKYRIQKQVNGKVKYYGTYQTIKEARKKRDKLEKTHWRK
ncbi:hypothetical protein [Methanosphaera cuniculi]|nr:hypothetical protein [Methanosphaera cuniculi]